MSLAARALRSPIGWALLLLVAVLACASVFTIVPETQQAIIVHMGVPQSVVNRYRPGQTFGDTGAGLIARVPLLDQVVMVDKRVQTLDVENQALTSADGQPLAVDAFARFRVVDPTRAYLAARGDPRRVAEALRPVLGAALRTELGRLPASALLAPEHQAAMHTVQADLDRAARTYGARVTEVRLDRTSLPDGAPLDSALARMRNQRQQMASAIREDGYKQAMGIHADGDAEAAKIYQSSFGQDPQFYDFYRAMQSYRATFAPDHPNDGSTQMVLSPNSEYLRQFRTGGKQ
jgi:modulator of FtsH protease HflC